MSDQTAIPPSPPAELAAEVAKLYCRLTENAANAGIELPDSSSFPGDLHKVFACSEFVAQSCIRNPSLLRELYDSGDLERSYEAGDLDSSVESALTHINDEAALIEALRKLKRRELVRIAWRDICNLSTFEQTVAETSTFADCVLNHSLHHIYAWQTAQRGVPTDEDGSAQQLVVLALGKLGASELNFSSDIDLIFTFPRSGNTVGAARSLENEEFFIRLARRYINVLSQTTADGFVFRVDMRLRPFGESGRLVCSMSAMEDYYQIHGRDWERYALIRARPVAGDIEAGNELLERLRPFVFRRYIDFGALESLREMKAMVMAEVTRKTMQDNVKLGPGGIREIEFVGQAFQLVRGGRFDSLRGRQIVPMLVELGRREFLPDYAVEDLRDAYRFLRTVEHRLQQVDEQQTHALPTTDFEKLRLSYALGFDDWQSLEKLLARHRERVQSHFDQVFGTPSEYSEETDPLASVWTGTLDTEQLIELLAQNGFADAREVGATLEQLRGSHAVKGLEQRGQSRLARLVPALLRTVLTRELPLLTLKRVATIIEAIARRSVYLALLVERPLALSQLVKLCEASPMVSRQFARYPLLLDELLDSRTLYAPLDAQALSNDMQTRLDAIDDADVEREMDALRHFKQSNLLHVAAADLTQAIDIDEVSERLTHIAEVAIDACLRLAWRDLTRRHGEPHYVHEGKTHKAPFCIVAYGKFGGQELSYGSDLDLVFLHGSHGEAQHTDGGRIIENNVFFPRLAQRIIHYVSTHTAVGSLYTVDARLRPSGTDGLLVTSLASFEQYQREQAWTWEHQALVRARVVAGDPALAEQFESTRRALIELERDPASLRQAVRDMRHRMQTQLGSKDEQLFDIKQDRGGIADIEFMVQYGALAWALKLRNYLHFTDNLRLLSAMADEGLLETDDAHAMADAYRDYRAWVHHLTLAEQPALLPADELADTRARVSTIWRQLMDD